MTTFYDRFVECAERWPANIALEIQRSGDLESYTYAELRKMAESIGNWLQQQGLEPGSRCAILADNHPRWVAAYLGIICSACTAVPLDTAFHAHQVSKLLRDSGSSLLFSDAKHWKVSEEAIKEIPVKLVAIGRETGDGQSGRAGKSPARVGLDDLFATGPGNFVPITPAPDSIASLLYTSGTTADPKGVMLTHANLLGEADAVFGWADLGPTDAILGVLPLFHVLSQMANLLFPLSAGARGVFLETLNTTELLRALQERGISAFAVVPQFFYLIHERIFKEVSKRGVLVDRIFRTLMRTNRILRRVGINAGPVFFGKIHKTFGSKMRYLVTGGSRFDAQIGHDFYALGIDVLQAYGLTETSGGAFVTDPRNNVIGSVGKPLPGVQGKIIDPQPQEDGPPAGEIAIHGAIVMKGYWKRPDATSAVLREGWLYTGDLGYFDKHGNLFITGRRKEVIVLSNGKNVYPEEIEAQYLKSPYIKEICVLGLEGKPGEPMSDQLYAVVVPNFDALKERKIINTKEVIRFAIESHSSQLASTKRITNYEIWQDDLPRTTTRKIKRFEVEKRVRAGVGKNDSAAIPSEKPPTEEETAWLDDAKVQRAIKVIKEASREVLPQIRPDYNLELDLGLDSMQRVELLVALEGDLGGDVPESEIANIYTVRQLVDAVLQSAASGKTSRRPQFAGWSVLLKEAPTEPEVLELIESRPFAEIFWFAVTRFLQLLARDLYQLRVEGLEKLPTDRPVIISSNHQSFIDPVVLASLFPLNLLRKSFAVGTSEIFGAGFMRLLARWIRVIAVDPDANLIPAMRAAAFGLRHDRTLILYPEGERSVDGTPKTFRKGAAILSVHLQVPIVPVAIDGFYEAWPRGRHFFQKVTKLRMKFGDPIYPPPEAQASETTYENLTAELKTRVVEMWMQLPKD